MALILPKGIVVNSPETAGSIARYNAEPLDLAHIATLWKVYTTTQRRLLDPTAERLENLWWRIWGSRKRALKGATVERLFTQISEGETFVPLRGPPNRYEGRTKSLRARRSHRPAISASTASLHKQSRPSTTASSSSNSNSRSQGPMPHPILKKSRGPPTPGPRPTARFISPHESENEQEPDSAVSTNSHVLVIPPTPIEPRHSPSESLPSPPLTQGADAASDKKATSTSLGKKKGNFVASRKKRPVIVRRQSSQSSTDNMVRASEATHQTSISAIHSSAERTPPMLSTPSRNAQSSKFQENFSLSPDKPKSKSSRRGNSKSGSSKSGSRRSTPRCTDTEFGIIHEDQQVQATLDEPGPSNQLRRIENLQNFVDVGIEATAEQVEVQRALLEEANNRMKKMKAAVTALPTSPTIAEVPEGPPQILHKSLRSNSDMTHDFHNMRAMRLIHNHQNKSDASLAPTLTTVSGEIEHADGGSSGAESCNSNTPKTLDKGKGRDPEDLRQIDMFAKRPIQPVQPALASEGESTLARSKSQLTLMLERDRSRSGEHKAENQPQKLSGKK